MDILDDKEKQLVAFALFTLSMRSGPDIFASVEQIAAKLGAEKPLKLFAHDWISYSNTIKEAEEKGVGLFQDIFKPSHMQDQQSKSVYYVHYHGNDGELWLQLPGADWSCWGIEYAMDACCRIRESRAQAIAVNDLPAAITENFDFNRTKDRVREAYKLL